jgi:glucose-6-phosphate 1-dehydrogenase
VLFGVTGDLAKRKLLPGLYHLFIAGLLPDKFRIIGSAPPEFALSGTDFVAHAESAVAQFGRVKPAGSKWEEFASCLSFGAASPEDPSPLVSAVRAAESAAAVPVVLVVQVPSGGCTTWRCRRPRSRP